VVVGGHSLCIFTIAATDMGERGVHPWTFALC
jgi:hypothetical protein